MAKRTTAKGTRPPSTVQHRLLRSSRAELRHVVPGVDLPAGKEVWRCSCANPPVWTGSRKQVEEQHREHVAAQSPEKPHPEDEIVESPDGTVTVGYGFASRGGQPSHRGEIVYDSKSAYEQAVDSGSHDKHRVARWYGALAANRGDVVVGDIVDESPHPENVLSGVHPVDDPANRVEPEPVVAPEPLQRRYVNPNTNEVVVFESVDGVTWQIVEEDANGTV
jgi:hypothetical protein